MSDIEIAKVAAKTLTDFMVTYKRGMNVYLLSDPSVYDPHGSLADEAKIVQDYIPVQSTTDLVQRLIAKSQDEKRPILVLTISSHGSSNHFRIGKDWVDENSTYIETLKKLTTYFSRDAQVFIRTCDTGQDRALLQKLSTIWGGIRVTGWTGTIHVSPAAIYSGGLIYYGDQVVCMRNDCQVQK